jgi:hypothetical protein
MMFGFLFRKYQQITKNVKNKKTWSQEKLKHSTDTWVTKFVQANLRSQLTSWLRELESFFPEELPFGIF